MTGNASTSRFWIFDQNCKVIAGPYSTEDQAKDSMHWFNNAHHVAGYHKEFPSEFDIEA